MSSADPKPTPTPAKKRRKVPLYILLGIPLAVVIVATILTIFIEVRQRQYRESLIQKAAAAKEKGELDKALFNLTQFLKLKPGQFEAVSMMGEILTVKAKTRDELMQARQVVRSVLAKAPGRRDDRKRAIALSMKLGDHASAANDIQQLIEQAGAGDVSDLEYQLGECREAMRVFDQAIRALRARDRDFSEERHRLRRRCPSNPVRGPGPETCRRTDGKARGGEPRLRARA